MSHFLPGAVVEKATPQYPATAVAVGASGLVKVKLLIDSKGKVRRACVVDGHPLLHATSLEAAYAHSFNSNFGLTQPQP